MKRSGRVPLIDQHLSKARIDELIKKPFQLSVQEMGHVVGCASCTSKVNDDTRHHIAIWYVKVPLKIAHHRRRTLTFAKTVI